MQENRLSSISRRRLLGGLAVSGLVACTPDNGRPDLVEANSPTTTFPRVGQVLREPAPAEPISAEEVQTVDADRSVVATALPALLEVRDAPEGEVTHLMENPTPTGGPLVFLTTQNESDWHEVLLPVRPNGSTGWVRTADVSLAAHHYRIGVDLAAFRMRVFDRGQTIFDAVAGVARDNAPTPGGRYYITELLAPLEPDTIYGTFAYGLSGFSETFETFNGGPGQLGIHGTNEPETLGSAVSAGCIRLHNNDVERLVRYLPLGVPVDVA